MISILAIRPSADVMSAFDALPKALREAIASAPFAFDPEEISQRLARGKSAGSVAREIERISGGAA
ncbi:hypothetical protein CN188_04130 [Sinorhizobium meliloti]|uniref:DUF6525 family protein n=1 Tax=Rhizobium meliloti TaxID=382 RepID=UPI000FD9397C|nr:DUF6525 family protein [Sinorhizobium meliloti]RVI86883.1 hypothetical protein CN188_04130 [Sinorhizobium meliloti]